MTAGMRTPLMYALQQNEGFPQILNFHDCVRNVDWRSILTYAEKRVDILVYYWSSWVDAWEEELKVFLSKPEAKLRLVVADPRNPMILKDIKKLFPEHSEQELIAKIKSTQRKLNKLVESLPEPRGSVELFLLSRPVSYPCQRIDDEIVVFSIFEMYRQRKVDAPSVVVNLQESPHLRQFFDKEWEGILREAVRCDLSKQI
jgi:hypothetical protein